MIYVSEKDPDLDGKNSWNPIFIGFFVVENVLKRIWVRLFSVQKLKVRQSELQMASIQQIPKFYDQSCYYLKATQTNVVVRSRFP